MAWAGIDMDMCGMDIRRPAGSLWCAAAAAAAAAELA